MKNKILRFGQFLYELPVISNIIRMMWNNRFCFSKPKITQEGFKFIGSKEMITGNYEIKVKEKVLELLESSDVFINIGANNGYYSCLALNLNKHVIAIEPMRENLKLLYRNVKNNYYQDVEIFPMAVSDKSGLLKIYGGGTDASFTENLGNASNKVFTYVPTTTIDKIIGDRFKNKKVCILMDIEGAEYKALLGATNLLKQKPTWIIEISGLENQNHGNINPNYSKVFELFWSLDYEAFDFENYNKKITRQDLEEVMKGNKVFGGNIYFSNTIDKTV